MVNIDVSGARILSAGLMFPLSSGLLRLKQQENGVKFRINLKSVGFSAITKSVSIFYTIGLILKNQQFYLLK